jgi:hypothetical protein
MTASTQAAGGTSRIVATDWFAEDTRVPAWSTEHPLFKRFGATPENEVVCNEFGACEISVPNVPNDDLRRLIAYAAADTQRPLLKAQRMLSYCVMEMMAQVATRAIASAYESPGAAVGTLNHRHIWRDEITGWGVKVAPQADNYFISLLTAIYGPDPSNKLGRMALVLDRWMTIWRPGPALLDENSNTADYGWPSPELYDEIPGTSDMVAWMRRRGWGYGVIAERHRLWLKQRDCVRCRTHYVIADHNGICPKCQRPAFDLVGTGPRDGDICLFGRFQGELGDTNFVHAEHHRAERWIVHRWEPNNNDEAWTPISEPIGDYDKAEAEAARLRIENYSESIKPSPAQVPPSVTRSGAEAAPTAAPAPGKPSHDGSPGATGSNETGSPLTGYDAMRAEYGEDTFNYPNPQSGDLAVIGLIAESLNKHADSPYLDPDDPRATEFAVKIYTEHEPPAISTWIGVDDPHLFPTRAQAEARLVELKKQIGEAEQAEAANPTDIDNGQSKSSSASKLSYADQTIVRNIRGYEIAKNIHPDVTDAEIASGWNEMAQKLGRATDRDDVIRFIKSLKQKPVAATRAASTPSSTRSASKPFAVPKQEWPKTGKPADPPHGNKVVDLEEQRLRCAAEERAAELEKKLAATERDRDQWKTTAQQSEPQQWREAPDDFAKSMRNTDIIEAINFYNVLEHHLRGTPEWNAFIDERLRRALGDQRKIAEDIAADKKADANADPKERRIARIRRALELALHKDTDATERTAAFDALLRMTTDGDLGFLDRLSDADRDAPQQTAQIAEGGSPIDWFLGRTTEQLREDAERQAEQHADRLDELRLKISAFLNTLRKASLEVPA